MQTFGKLSALPDWFASHLDGEFDAEWRTIVQLEKLKRDRQSSAFDPQEFIVELQTRFSIAMRRLGALVRLVYVDRRGKVTVYDINPMEYVGEELDVVQYDSPETGQVEIGLRLAPEVAGQQRGIVVVMRTGDNTAVSINDFSRQALVPSNKPSKGLRDALAALRSRRFAGEIRVQLLALDIERGMFAPGEGVLNRLYEFIERWYAEVGWFHFELGVEEARDKRWAAATAAGQQSLAALLSQPQFASLVDSVAGVLGGSGAGRSAGAVIRHPVGEDEDESGTEPGEGAPRKERTGTGRKEPEGNKDDDAPDRVRNRRGSSGFALDIVS
jgi:hypothetical protein